MSFKDFCDALEVSCMMESATAACYGIMFWVIVGCYCQSIVLKAELSILLKPNTLSQSVILVSRNQAGKESVSNKRIMHKKKASYSARRREATGEQKP